MASAFVFNPFHGVDNLMSKEQLRIRIERQDHPSHKAYWQTFVLEYEPGLNITSVLQRICARPITDAGEKVAPVA